MKAIEYKGQVQIQDPMQLFYRFVVSDDDIDLYKKLMDEGEEEKAIDMFIDTYMVSISELYGGTISYYLNEVQRGEMTQKDKNGIEKSVILLSSALALSMNNNFRTFTKEVYAPVIFDELQITSAKVKRAVFDATIAQFEELTEGAMNETSRFILRNIRQMQREIVIENQRIGTVKEITGKLNKEVNKFRERVRREIPGFYEAMEEGKILKSKKIMRNGQEIVYHYRLENYAGMATRTTILNVDRTATEVHAKVEELPVVEYYLRDNRPLKTGKEREICKFILKHKYMGKSVLALDEETAGKLGIMSLTYAKENGAMGPYCRHSIKPVSKTYLRKIQNNIEAA